MKTRKRAIVSAPNRPLGVPHFDGGDSNLPKEVTAVCFHDPLRLVRTLAFALRHNPWKFGLRLDPEGWTAIDALLPAIQLHCPEWAQLTWPDIEAAIGATDRFVIHRGRIRAAYGHSVALAELPDVADPPPALFHGTSRKAFTSILQHGLRPMTRRFVHFSSDLDWVIDFVCEKPQWVILSIHSKDASDAGVRFRRANKHVWLAESIEAQFLSVHLSNFETKDGLFGLSPQRSGPTRISR